MSYRRVIPRDLFNEAKLLKCLGMFHLAVIDKKVNGLDIEIQYEGEPFDIQQNPNCGSLYCSNYKAFLDGDEIELRTPYNSKEQNPLLAIYRGEEYYVFLVMMEDFSLTLDFLKRGKRND